LYNHSKSITNIIAIILAMVFGTVGVAFGFLQAFMLFFGLSLLVIFIVKFEKAFLAFLILRPTFEIFSYIGLEIGHSFLNLSAAMSMLFVFSAITFIITQKKYLRLPKELYMFAFFLGFALISTLYNYNIVKWDGLFSFFRLVTIFLIMIIIWLEYRDNRKINILLTCLMASTIIPLVYAISQIFGHFNMTVEDGIPRINGGFAHSNVFASYVGIFIILAFSILMVRKHSKLTEKVMLYSWITVLFLCLFYTYNRGAWLSVCLALAVTGLLFFRKKMFLMSFLVVMILLSLPLILENNPFFTTVANRFENVQFWNDWRVLTDESNSFGWRVSYWKDLLKVASKSPIIGYGLGSVANIGRENMEAHNNYVQVFFETGLGALFYFLCVLMFLIRAYERVREAENLEKYICIAAVGLIVYFFIISINAHLIRNTVIQIYFFAILTTLICYDKLSVKENISDKLSSKPSK